MGYKEEVRGEALGQVAHRRGVCPIPGDTLEVRLGGALSI